MATPKWRAGTNLQDPTRSGFARVNVLGQDDLFPDEGYEFRNIDKRPRETLTTKVSDDSPFHVTTKYSAPKNVEADTVNMCRDELTRSELLYTRTAAKAIAAPTPGELRPINSKIAAETVIRERADQVKIREKIRMARMKDDAFWEDIENREAQATIEIGKDIQSIKRGKQQDLATDYFKQFDLHDKRKEAEMEEDRQEYLKNLQILKEEEEKDKERQARLHQIALERKKEFQLKNDELLMRRQNKIEQDIKDEMKIAKEHAELEEQMEKREERMRRIRDEKNARRDRLIKEQTKVLEEAKAKQIRVDSNAESEVSRRAEMERRKKLRLIKDMQTQRNKEWHEYQVSKDMSKLNQIEEADYIDTGEDDFRKAEREQRALNNRRLKQFNEKFSQQRQQKEQQETAYRRKHKDNMFFVKDNEW